VRVRTLEDLDKFLAASSARRKQELVWYSHQLVPTAKPSQWVPRSAIVLAYAHWEGFVKDAATAYLEYVTYKTKRLSDLALNFQALACRQEILSAQPATKKILPHIAVAKKMIEELDSGYQIYPSTAIDTESNLNADVFENICTSIGVDYQSLWSTSGKFMDDLFRTRCAIAHGELCSAEPKVALASVQFVIKAVDDFSTQIGNAASLQHYLKPKPPA
jgi:hypothetical protein